MPHRRAVLAAFHKGRVVFEDKAAFRVLLAVALQAFVIEQAIDGGEIRGRSICGAEV